MQLSSQRHRRPRQAFTLVELLVVIAIIGILIGMLLPAVQQVREAARRSKCSNNARQIALAIHNYEGTMSRFPPGYTINLNASGTNDRYRYSWLIYLLPFVEQQNLSDVFQELIAADDPAMPSYSWPMNQTVLPLFVCPSDKVQGKVNSRGFHGNYQLVHGGHSLRTGAGANEEIAHGLFFVKSKIELTEIHDGTSNVLMVGEINLVDGDVDRRGRYFMTGFNSANCTIATLDQPNSPAKDQANSQTIQEVLPWAPAAGLGNSGGNWLRMAARSHHRGGVIFSNADCSTRFVSNDIDLVLYNRLGNRDSGQVKSID